MGGAAISSSNAHTMKGAWHFVTIPRAQSDSIKKLFGRVARVWGSPPITIMLDKTIWKTSIFPDKKLGAYLLPVKTDIRKKDKIKSGDTINFILEVVS